MKFYEDQHKLAAYLERKGAKFEYQTLDMQKRSLLGGGVWTASEYVKAGHPISPVLRYGLPSHLQSEIANPDNLTEEQICEGGKYRAVVKLDSCNQSHELFTGCGWVAGFVDDCAFEDLASTYRLPAAVPWPDWEAAQHVTKDGVHTSHCCKDHGCKYGDDGCPVVTGRLKQEYPCEDCSTKPDPKDARIAELEMQLLALSNSCEMLRETCSKITSPWRRMSEVPTEEECDPIGRVLAAFPNSKYLSFIQREDLKKIHLLAWMPVPKFHGWPDPLADLLKAHGVAVTPELAAALNAWKGAQP